MLVSSCRLTHLSFMSKVAYMTHPEDLCQQSACSMGFWYPYLFEDNARHYLPHIHVRYSGEKASVAIADGSILAGSIPASQLKMVQAWIEIHKDELYADWELAVSGEELFRIAPLQ